MDLDRALEPTAGIADTRMLARLGLSSRDIRRAVDRGQLRRLRRGRYASRRAWPEVASAVAAGGRLACVSALHAYGAWVMHDGLLHIRAGRGVEIRQSPTLRIHWTDDRGWDPAIDPVATAFATSISCLALDHAVVVADSLANRSL
ncbi:MAG: type IV toxin-antitoxin system AbiEi family antitoxin domain-containing protein, partial [Leifsonia sp.]